MTGDRLSGALARAGAAEPDALEWAAGGKTHTAPVGSAKLPVKAEPLTLASWPAKSAPPGPLVQLSPKVLSVTAKPWAVGVTGSPTGKSPAKMAPPPCVDRFWVKVLPETTRSAPGPL